MLIEIYVDNYNNICYPGQTISGRIEITCNGERNLRAIRVQFRGRAKTAWTETELYTETFSRKLKTRSIDYSAEEIYMDAEYNLVQDGEDFSLSAGKHGYPFSYILPPQLPSAFEGTEGNIRYYVKAIVNRPCILYTARVALNVASFIDLNFIPHIREPVTISDDKTMCSCWCNDAGALTFTLSLPIRVYVPGHDINIGAYVENLTNVSAEAVKFKVIAIYEYITHHPCTHTRYDFDEIASCVESGIDAHGEKSWTSTLRIPNDRIYPNLIPSSIINVRYSLRAKVVVPWPHNNLKLLYPITIGSVALSGVNTVIPSPSLPIEFALRNGLPPAYPPPNNADGCYPDKYPGGLPPLYKEKYPDGLSPPYLSGRGKSGSIPSAPMNGPSPYSSRATAPPLGVIPSFPAPAGGSSAYPPFPSRSAPYPPPARGSAPYPAPAGGSAPYPPAFYGSAQYPLPTRGSSSYPPEKTYWLEPNPNDTTASAPPPPSYEESQPQEKK